MRAGGVVVFAFYLFVACLLLALAVRAWDAERPYARPDVEARVKALGVR